MHLPESNSLNPSKLVLMPHFDELCHRALNGGVLLYIAAEYVIVHEGVQGTPATTRGRDSGISDGKARDPPHV